MTKTINIKELGEQIRIAVTNSSKTRELIVVNVQDRIRPHGASFSLAGLDKLCKGEAPKRDAQLIIKALLETLEMESIAS